MNGDARASRLSVQRTASVTRNALQSGSLFTEPPVALPNLDELRAADLLVRAYYTTLVKVPPPSNPTPLSLAMDQATVQTNVDAAEHARSVSLRPSSSPPSATNAASLAIVAAEAKATGEMIGAAIARDVVDAAATLFTSRRLDDLVESYTACATWDDARDVVASAFLPQDLCGNGLQADNAEEAFCDTLQSARKVVLSSSTTAVSPPVFMLSALALAGVATRTPSCTLTPQSSLLPPPLGTSVPVQCTTHNTAGPTPPASVPMDAFARYVTVVEEAPTPTAAAAATRGRLTSSARALLVPRSRATKNKPKSVEGTTTPDAAAGGPTAAATATPAGALTLSPSPPVNANAAGKRSSRASQKRSAHPSQASSQPEPVFNRGKTLFGPTTQPVSEDPLTRALRQGLPNTVGDAVPGASKAERSPGRQTGGGVGLSSSSFPSVTGVNDAARKAMGRQSSPRGGYVVAVEQDRLWCTDRGGKSLQRGGPRKDGVRCRVMPSGEAEGGVAIESAVAADANAVVIEGENANVEVADSTLKGKRGGRRTQPNTVQDPTTSKAKKAAAEREAWTASFFNATDAAGEMSLQDQVRVTPSPGVTVVGGLPAQMARRGRKGTTTGAVVGTGSVVHGGDFTVPADRLALSVFEEKRAGVRKPNVPGRATNPATTRPSQAFRTV